jgi:hypothetical protein
MDVNMLTERGVNLTNLAGKGTVSAISTKIAYFALYC